MVAGTARSMGITVSGDALFKKDMAKLTKKAKRGLLKIENKLLKDAAALIKVIASAKFDESVDIAVRLGVDPRKANQMVRGVVTLPHGTGKDVKVLALVTPDKEAEAFSWCRLCWS
jgi:large subunit ribosomal protein L1